MIKLLGVFYLSKQKELSNEEDNWIITGGNDDGLVRRLLFNIMPATRTNGHERRRLKKFESSKKGIHGCPFLL
jgi:hypothetical protein